MNTTYCHCGARNEYRGVRPKFCSSCGDSLDSTAAFRTPPAEGADEESDEREATGGERFRNHVPGHLEMEISVEIEGGSEVTANGQVGVKRNVKLTSRDFRTGGTSIAAMPKQI